MAPIDHSIYMNRPDIGASFERGMKLSEIAEGKKKRQAEAEEGEKIKQVFASNMNPDGTFKSKEIQAQLSAINPEKGFEYGSKFAQQEQAGMQNQKLGLEQNLAKIKATGQLALGAKDQASWEAALDQGAKLGLDVSQAPRAYDPNFVQSLIAKSLTVEQSLQKQLEEQRMASASADRKDAREERRQLFGAQRQDRLDARTDKMEEKMQGLKTPYGLANTVDDAKQLKEGHEAKRNFDNKLDQMIALRESKGGEVLDREAVARGQQLSKDLLLEYKNMSKLGVLSAADQDIINAIIPEDPLQFNSPLAAMQGQDPTLTRLKAFKADSDKDFQTRISTRTRAGIDGAANKTAQFEPDVLKYAQAHGITPEAAQTIKAQRTSATAGR
jgi:hypothetical protein